MHPLLFWSIVFFWVADLPEKMEDRESHALAYDVENRKLFLVNKSFMEHVIVVVEEKK